jgi:two-component system phosphate regulon sensor histidine kinase PhoR
LQTVLRESKRMLSLVEDLMALSLVEAEKHDRPTEEVDLVNLAGRVVAEIAAVRGESRLTVTGGEPVLLVLGEPRQLDQLLRNLIDNALKYGEPGTPVEVKVDRDGAGSPRLTVTDQGPGVAAEFIPHLTRRFYRTDPGRSRASGGTGLGLAIVKHIVERHLGRLDIASKLGRGTVVTITLPPANPVG